MTCLSKDPISRELSPFYFYRRKMPKRLRPVRRDIKRKSVGGYKIQEGGKKKVVKVLATQFAAAFAFLEHHEIERQDSKAIAGTSSAGPGIWVALAQHVSCFVAHLL